MEELKRQMQPKRSHTHDDAGDDHEMLTEVDNWDLIVHRRETTCVHNRRNVQVGSLESSGAHLVVQGCTQSRTNQTCWTEDQFVVTVSSGIWDRDTRVAEIVTRELQKTKPG